MGVNCCSHDREPPEITINKPEKNINAQNQNLDNAQDNNLVVINPSQYNQTSSNNHSYVNSDLIYHSTEQNIPQTTNENADLNKYFTTDNSNKKPLAYTEKEIQDIFNQAMKNSGVNVNVLNGTNNGQSNIQNNPIYQNENYINNLNNQNLQQNKNKNFNINYQIPQNQIIQQRNQQKQIITQFNQNLPQNQQNYVIYQSQHFPQNQQKQIITQINQNLPQNQQKHLIYQNQNLPQNQPKQVLNRPLQQIQNKQIVNGSIPLVQNQNVVQYQNIIRNINQNINQQINPYINQNQIINPNIKNNQQNINQNQKITNNISKSQEQNELSGLNINELFNKNNNDVGRQVNNIMYQYQSPNIEGFIKNQPKANNNNVEELLKQPQNSQSQIINDYNFDELFKEGGNKQINDKLIDKLFSLPSPNNLNKNNQIQNQNNQNTLYLSQQISPGKQEIYSNQNFNLTPSNSPNRNIQ